jgi:hypothetical protein
MSRRREMEDAVRAVAARVGAEVTIERSRRHPRAVLHYGGRSQFIVLSCSPSDARAYRSAAQDGCRTLRKLGAAI